MRLKFIHKQESDDLAFLFRLQHILTGALRFARPEFAHLVKVDGWFGPRWRGFAGTRGGKDIVELDRLCAPPFAPKRVVSERSFRRKGNHLWRVGPRKLHDSPPPKSPVRRSLEDDVEAGLFVWFSGNTAGQDRGCLMVYEVTAGEPGRAWYVELVRRDATWTVSQAIGTSTAEIDQLETSYANQLQPLFQRPLDQSKKAEIDSWNAALAAIDEGRIAEAQVLIPRHRERFPDDAFGRTLRAMLLTHCCYFEEAEAELRAIEAAHKAHKWRELWVYEWARLCEQRGDLEGEEAARREYATLSPDDTGPWIHLGACLARNGKHEEALAIHRHATDLEGDPDEAFLNVGLILRAQGKIAEAAEAFESALKLCPDYPAASKALEDVRAAMTLLEGAT